VPGLAILLPVFIYNSFIIESKKGKMGAWQVFLHISHLLSILYGVVNDLSRKIYCTVQYIYDRDNPGE
jgi:hypothetical protein